MQMRPILWQTHAEAARTLATIGRQKEADVHWAEAQRVVDEIAALFEDHRLRAVFQAGAQSSLSSKPNQPLSGELMREQQESGDGVKDGVASVQAPPVELPSRPQPA